jgi:hypothetical protein
LFGGAEFRCHPHQIGEGFCFHLLDNLPSMSLYRDLADAKFSAGEDEEIAELDTLLLTVPNQLGFADNAHVLEAILMTTA